VNELKPQQYNLIIGLGNPEKEYEGTRHNVGFGVVDRFSEKYQIALTHDKKLSSWCGKANLAVNGVVHQVILAKPDTYMNHSGIAVSKLLNWYKLDISSLLVVHDEVALDLGKIRISNGVLDKFTNKEKEILSKVVHLSVEAIETLLEESIEFTMNKYNGVTV
jgi:peptidyl-tRNA hydrolase, PTH1 family